MNPLSDFERVVASANFEVLEAKIGAQIKWFERKYRWLDPDDLKSASGAAYTEAIGTFNPELGKFEVWVLYKVHKALKTVLRNTARRNKRTKNLTPDAELHDPLDQIPYTAPEPSFWLDEWLALLSSDARRVAMMVFEPPFGVHVRVAELGGFETPEAFRSGVREVLRDGGWQEWRIEAAFTEIQRSL